MHVEDTRVTMHFTNLSPSLTLHTDHCLKYSLYTRGIDVWIYSRLWIIGSRYTENILRLAVTF
jgi:hypothetical protein